MTVMIRVIGFALVIATALDVDRVDAQCNSECQGDFNLDGQVTIEEILISVTNALGECAASAEQQGCLASGGTLSTIRCCTGAPQFPDTCSIGPCGCAPDLSTEVSVCDCGQAACFDRSVRACIRF